jgi:hypothetical protein
LAVAAASTAKRRAARRGTDSSENLPPAIRLKQKRSGKEKRISTGFAWDLFLCAGLFGVPLFWRRLHAWGAVILALWCVDLVIGRLPISEATAHSSEAALFVVFLLLQLFLGFMGNRLTARAFLAHGWILDPANDLATKRVIERWKLAG